MARYFYAFRWAYDIGTTWDDGSWPGSLRVFDSRAERDAWVADDVLMVTGIVSHYGKGGASYHGGHCYRLRQ